MYAKGEKEGKKKGTSCTFTKSESIPEPKDSDFNQGQAFGADEYLVQERA